MNIPEKFWNTARVLLIVLSVFIVIVAVKSIREIAYVGSSPDINPTISVDGTGYSYKKPDVAEFTFTVQETAKTVAEAQKAATDKTNAALKVVRDAGIAEKDFLTEAYNINPHYEYQSVVCPRPIEGGPTYCPGGKSVITGYDVSQSVKVRVRDLEKAGALFSSIGTLGVQNVNNLVFTFENPDVVQAEARAAAIEAARVKAEVLASRLGVRLGRIVSFNENGYYPMYKYARTGAVSLEAADAAPVPQVPTGEQKISSTVNITYEIK